MQADDTEARHRLKGFHLALKSEQRLQPMVWYGCNLCNLWRLWVLILVDTGAENRHAGCDVTKW